MTHKQRVLDLLSDGQPHSHKEGYALGVMLHSRVADLRGDGHQIVCWRDGALSMYRLIDSLGEPSPNHHVCGEEAWGVKDGDRLPSETGDTAATSPPHVADPTPVSLTLFDEVAA